MLGALVIVFREVLEAGLIVGITLAATRGIAGRGLWIGSGVLGGILAACLVAVFVTRISAAFEGVGQELFNAGILGIAVAMLGWHSIWMARHGRALAMEMRQVGRAVVAGTTSLAGLALVVGVAVLREGAEVALFLYGIAVASEPGSGPGLILGGVLGLALGGAVGIVTYLGLLQIPSRYLFGVTNVLLALLAAGMAAQAVALLEQANVVSVLGDTLWDSSELLSDSSLIGRALHTLIGYSDHPTGLQAVVYAAVLAAILGMTRVMQSKPFANRSTATA